MKAMWKPLAALLCALSILCSAVGALAEFSPRYEKMKQGEGMILELQGTYSSLAKLSSQSLETVNGWLAKMKITAASARDGSVAQTTVFSGDQEVFSALTQRLADGNVTFFRPSGGAYQTGSRQKDALALLAGEETHLYLPGDLIAFYQEAAKALFPVLGAKTTVKSYKTRTTIKNALPSAAYENYVLKAEEMNALWPEIRAAIQPALQGALTDQPGLLGRLEALLGALQFSGECRIKRFLDKEKGDMGLQFTGVAARGEDARKITLFGGFTPGRGGYVSFSAPAVKGKNTLKVTLGGRLTENKSGLRTLTLEGTFSRTFDKVSTAASLNGTLKNTVKNEDETWTGRLTWTETKNKVKTAYTFTPDLIFTQEGLQGKVTVQRKTGGRTDMKAVVNLSLKEGAPEAGQENVKILDLSKMEEANARAAVQGELAGPAALVARLMNGLSEEERALLTHELRTDGWMTDGVVPAEEEDGPQALEEETAPEGEKTQDEEWPEVTGEDDWFTQDDGDDWFTQDDGDDWFGGEEEWPETEEEPEPEPTPSPKPTVTPAPTPGEDVFDEDWFGEDW